jgi:hypothetical protein
VISQFGVEKKFYEGFPAIVNYCTDANSILNLAATCKYFRLYSRTEGSTERKKGKGKGSNSPNLQYFQEFGIRFGNLSGTPPSVVLNTEIVGGVFFPCAAWKNSGDWTPLFVGGQRRAYGSCPCLLREDQERGGAGQVLL